MIRGLILDSVCRGRPTTHWFHHKTWTNAGSGFLFQQKNWCNDFYSSPFYSSLDIHSSYHRFFSLQVPSADTQEIPGTCWLTIQVLLQMNLPLELGYKFVTKGRLISEVLESGGKLGRLGLVTWRWSLSIYIIIYILYILYIIYIPYLCVCWGRHAQRTAIYHEPIVEGHPKTTQWTRQKWSMDMLHLAKIDPWPKHLGMVARSNKRFVGRYPRF
jgi:hypothetical protein